jgi:trimeric autotransporter adhesin
MNPLIQLKKIIALPLLVALALAFGLSPTAQALLPPPPPDGGYPNGNTAEGDYALFSLTTGRNNTAIGNAALYSNTTGNGNTANGFHALLSNETGSGNTATGVQALLFNKTGSDNTATGDDALLLNTAGNFNTADGRQALYNNKTGNNNTATGFQALSGNKSGNSNTANGGAALLSNQSGGGNTASGRDALLSNTSGSVNTASGYQSLYHNKTAFFNTAMGSRALFSNETGFSNTANGYQALYLNETGGGNTATGVQALYRTTGGSNIALGFQAGVNLTTGDNNIDIGNVGVAAEANTIRIGTGGTHTKAFIAGISVSAISGTAVVVNSNGRLGVAASSARFKDAIKPMDKASEAILALKPVTFRYKQQIDPKGIPQFGLVAEEVDKVNPDLVVRDADGKPYTVRYDAVNAMLLNEFLKEHCKVEEQNRKIQEQDKTIAQLKHDFQFKLAEQEKQIKALASGLQKVSSRLELNKPALEMVVNEPQQRKEEL